MESCTSPSPLPPPAPPSIFSCQLLSYDKVLLHPYSFNGAQKSHESPYKFLTATHNGIHASQRAPSWSVPTCSLRTTTTTGHHPGQHLCPQEAEGPGSPTVKALLAQESTEVPHTQCSLASAGTLPSPGLPNSKVRDCQVPLFCSHVGLGARWGRSSVPPVLTFARLPIRLQRESNGAAASHASGRVLARPVTASVIDCTRLWGGKDAEMLSLPGQKPPAFPRQAEVSCETGELGSSSGRSPAVGL